MVGLEPRPYTIEEYTTTVCPHCFEERQRASYEAGVWKDGLLVSHDDKVWMRRFCDVHGETESLYEEDLAIWRSRQGWSTPTLQITPDRAGNFRAFPDAYRDGLPASHGQHTCILLLNVTERCNYACPTCYASARGPGTPTPNPEYPTIDDIRRTVRVTIERENGRLGVLMLSGGEPTVREDLPRVIEALADLPITRIMLNTNGRRIVRDDRFLEFLQRYRRRIEVYLQFDGLRGDTYQKLRGEDVAAEKLAALERLNEVRVFTTLVTTVQRGVNEDEIGDIVRFGLNTPCCAGMALQPSFGSGRTPGFDPRDRVTPTGVLRRLEDQTGGLLTADDFIPLPCSHRDCCDITYLLKTGDDQWKSIPKLIGKDELKQWVRHIANTISFEDLSASAAAMLQSGAIQRVFSEQLKVGTTDLVRDLTWMCDCVPGVQQLLGGIWARVNRRRQPSDAALEKAAERTFRITNKMFMDAHTFHASRLRQCCVHTGTFEDDPRRYSFCWRWLFADAVDRPSPMPANGRSSLEVIPLEASSS